MPYPGVHLVHLVHLYGVSIWVVRLCPGEKTPWHLVILQHNPRLYCTLTHMLLLLLLPACLSV